MTGSVADARLLFSVMTATSPDGSLNSKRRLIGMADSGPFGVDPACQDACHRAAAALEAAGHEVEPIQWDPEPVAQGYAVVRPATMASFPAYLSPFRPAIHRLSDARR